MFDEMLTKLEDQDSNVYDAFFNWLEQQDFKKLHTQTKEAENLFRKIGITFNIYNSIDGDDRVIPFDIIPRIITNNEWNFLERGIKQRVKAINIFLNDIYNDQEIIKAKILPSDMIFRNKAFLPQMLNFKPPSGIYTHVVGIDLIRLSKDEFVVLEDNLRVPSGVSYMIENRSTMFHLFPELFNEYNVKSVNNYPKDLYKSLLTTANLLIDNPKIVLLTPGTMNSAYYEHSFLADKMGIDIVEGLDLQVLDKKIVIKSTEGYKQVDLIYRRIDDLFLDPLTFDHKSLLGTPGIFDMYRAGKVILANAPGSGIADDKSIYTFIPKMINFYLGEKPILKNVETWRCSESDSCNYVLENLEKLVVKEVHGSGGYGMLVGPAANKKEIKEFKMKLKANPDNYIAQPTLSLSTVPILSKSGLSPRHVDLRPFVLMSPKQMIVTKGGLTRVALKKNSLVVNSSQGGGTKDTWIIDN